MSSKRTRKQLVALLGENAADNYLSWAPEPTMLEMVQEFHCKHRIKQDKFARNPVVSALRVVLIDEELQELREALYLRDRVAIADALGDLLYVVFGAADVYGIDIDQVFREIHRSNMTKVSDGGQNEKIHKINKGPEYSPPDLSFVSEDS